MPTRHESFSVVSALFFLSVSSFQTGCIVDSTGDLAEGMESLQVLASHSGVLMKPDLGFQGHKVYTGSFLDQLAGSEGPKLAFHWNLTDLLGASPGSGAYIVGHYKRLPLDASRSSLVEDPHLWSFDLVLADDEIYRFTPQQFKDQFYSAKPLGYSQLHGQIAAIVPDSRFVGVDTALYTMLEYIGRVDLDYLGLDRNQVWTGKKDLLVERSDYGFLGKSVDVPELLEVRRLSIDEVTRSRSWYATSGLDRNN